jgi:YVTN family beta-propeller protein
VVYDCSTDAAVHYVKANGELSLICMDESRDVLFYKHEGHVKLLDVRTDTVTELLNAKGGWFCLAPNFNKLYCTDRGDSIIAVVDVRRDSVVARVHLGTGASGSMLYVPSEALVCAGTNSGLAVIDCQYDSVMAAVPFEGGTSAICYSPVSREVYCADGRHCVVRVVSGRSHKVTAIVPTSVALTTMCYDTKSDRLYCADAARDSVFSVDCVTWRTHRAISVPGDAVASYYNPDNNKAYVTYVVGQSRRHGAVCVVNCDNDSLLEVIRGPIRPMTHSPNHGRLYCSGEDNAVWIVDGSGDSVISRVKLTHPAVSACYDSSGDVLYVAGNTSLTAIDCAADSILSSAHIGNNLSDGIYYDPATKRVYCADFYASAVQVADARTCSLVKSIPAGRDPYNLCGAGNGGKVYCANKYDSTVTVIDAEGDSVLASLHIGSEPHEMLYVDSSDMLYCASQGEGSVSIIDGKTDKLVRTLAVGAGPASLVWSPKRSCVYVLNGGSSSISVIR